MRQAFASESPVTEVLSRPASRTTIVFAPDASKAVSRTDIGAPAPMLPSVVFE
jgi:hypothetical protein